MMYFLFKNEIIDYDFFNFRKPQTILFLHGWGGNKFSFAQTISLLKTQFNILSITLPTTQPTISIWTLFDFICLVENILTLHSITKPIIVCHSFGFRVAMLLNKKIDIEKIVVTGGAGLKNFNIFHKIIKNNNTIILKHDKFNNFYKKIASKDYLTLSKTNKETFKNIVNLNLSFAIKFKCPMLLFWGRNDKDTPLWIAKKLAHENNTRLIISNDDHFAYIRDSSMFNHEIQKFLNTIKYEPINKGIKI